MAKEQPHPAVVEWLAQSEDVDLFLSVITIEEIREGIELMDAGKRKRWLDLWLDEELLSNYRERILPITIEIADLCGRTLGDKETRRFNPQANDAYIAATARAHGLTVATLNRKHFEHLGVELVAFLDQDVQIDNPREAIEIIMMANHLLRIVDARRTQ